MDILSITCREDEIVLRTDITKDHTPAVVRTHTPASCEQRLIGEFSIELPLAFA